MRKFLVLLLCLFSTASLQSAQAGFIYEVSGNTSTLNGQTGFLQFSLGGLLDAANAVAQISELQGVLLGNDGNESLGDVQGDLSQVLSLHVAGDYAERLQVVTFGDFIHFRLELSSAVNGSDSGNSFALALLDAAFQPLLSDDAFGHWLRIELLPSGQNKVQAVGENVLVVPVTDVPLPATFALMFGGLLLLRPRRAS